MTKSEKKKLVLIEDDEVFARVLTRSLQAKGLETRVFHTVTAAREAQPFDSPDYIVLDLFLQEDSGFALLPELRKLYPQSKILILTGYASIATTVQAMKLGADNYLPKPANATQILKALESDRVVESKAEPEPLSVERLEWEHIQTVLAQNKGNISATARALGMHRRTLQRKLSKKPSQK